MDEIERLKRECEIRLKSEIQLCQEIDGLQAKLTKSEATIDAIMLEIGEQFDRILRALRQAKGE